MKKSAMNRLLVASWGSVKRSLYICAIILASFSVSCTDPKVEPEPAPIIPEFPAEKPDPDKTPDGENPNGENPPEEQTESDAPKFTSFVFTADKNPQLKGVEVKCTIEGDLIEAYVPSLESALELTPSFEGTFSKVLVNEDQQNSADSKLDFDRTVVYEVYNDKEEKCTYYVKINVFTKLPIVRIDTQGGAPILNKEDYVKGDMSISGVPDMDSKFQGKMSIKGRGNATWGYEKKPYRIKLDKKSEIVGCPSHKDWVLLAEYCDKSMLRNSYLFEMSKLVGLPWTSNSYHVELFLNGNYNGTYLLCEQVKEGETRVNIAADGFIFEEDNNYQFEPLWITSPKKGFNFTFKYPDPTGSSMAVGVGDDYNYIKNYISEFETMLYSAGYKDPVNGCRKWVDVTNLAQWYIMQEVIGNIDTNPYFVLNSRGAKLQMYPAWDSEWSLGLAHWDGWWKFPNYVSPVDKSYWRNSLYFDRLLSDPYFAQAVKEQWAIVKSKLPAFKETMKATAARVEYAQKQNFKRWKILGKYVSVGVVKFDTWQEEVDYAANFFEKRIQWLDGQIAGY